MGTNTTIKQAVILAGGLGTRLRPLTNDRPKPMVEVGGRPFLEYLVELLKENGIEEIVMLLGYLPERIMEHFGDGSKFGVSIEYSIGDVNLETGARIKKAVNLLDDNFLLMYSDNYWPMRLNELLSFHKNQGTLATMTAYSNKDNSTKNNIYTAHNGLVETYDSSRSAQNLNGVDIGFFIVSKKILDFMPENNFSFEKEILPFLANKKNLAGFMTEHKYYSIGSVDRIPKTERFLRRKKVVFLDRDGVINEKPAKAEYVKSWNEFRFLPGAVEAISRLTQNGYDVFIISNQAGVGRGMMSASDLENIHREMGAVVEKNGGKIAGIYCCLHDWNAGCECRKPKPGLFFQAAREHLIDLTKTIFIGDDERDKQAGISAGCRVIMVNHEQNLFDLVNEHFKDFSYNKNNQPSKWL